jgi:tRNA-dihydrouridine synthase A
MLDRKVSVAPMMDWTDRHDRYFLRLISRHVLLYTEMVTTGAILHGDRERLLGYAPQEHPVALQLGGSEPQALAQCARIGEDFGYDEINLNVGCPSDRVQTGRFGACLMAEPELVADCVAAMHEAVKIPVTVKTRLGIDDRDSYAELTHFISTVAAAGCEVFILHARKAWLNGLSPKENREIPPLRYDVVRAIKADFPQLSVSVNGGVKSLDEVAVHLEVLDGVMIGREAYHNPYLLHAVDQRFYGATQPPLSRREVVEAYLPYVAQQLGNGLKLNQMTRHILGLYQGLPGARSFRRVLSEQAHRPGASLEVIRQALAAVEPEVAPA